MNVSHCHSLLNELTLRLMGSTTMLFHICPFLEQILKNAIKFSSGVD